MTKSKQVGSGWKKHYRDTANNPPSSLLQEAIQYVTHTSHALDLGAGALKDTRFLLDSGFEHVAIVDSEPLVRDYAQQLPNEQISVTITPFSEYDFPKDAFDLINAQFSLPFHGPANFSVLMQSIAQSLTEGGVFVGQFFGINDEWNVSDTKLAFHSESEVRDFLSALQIISLREVEKDAKTADGQPKHWHLFHVIAQRPSGS